MPVLLVLDATDPDAQRVEYLRQGLAQVMDTLQVEAQGELVSIAILASRRVHLLTPFTSDHSQARTKLLAASCPQQRSQQEGHTGLGSRKVRQELFHHLLKSSCPSCQIVVGSHEQNLRALPAETLRAYARDCLDHQSLVHVLCLLQPAASSFSSSFPSTLSPSSSSLSSPSRFASSPPLSTHIPDTAKYLWASGPTPPSGLAHSCFGQYFAVQPRSSLIRGRYSLFCLY